jgi:hypothetical protein
MKIFRPISYLVSVHLAKRFQRRNEDRAREFQEFRNDFLTFQREKNYILKSLASHIIQK